MRRARAILAAPPVALIFAPLAALMVAPIVVLAIAGGSGSPNLAWPA